MTCKDCKHFQECLNEAMMLGQVFDPNYDGEHYCQSNKFEEKTVYNYDKYKLHRGIIQFVSEFTKQSYEDTSENNCEMIDWIQSRIEQSFKNE